MPSPNILPPNPSLVAILLVIKSLSGPRLVFHYPPHPVGPSSATPAHPQWYSTGSTLTDEDESTSSGSTTSGWSSDDGSGSDAASGDEAASTVDAAEGASRAGSRGTSKGTSRGTGLREGGGSRRGQRSLRSASEDVMEDDGDEDDTGLGDEEGRGGAGRVGAAGKKGDGGPEWENIMGFKSEGLEKLLCPGRGYNKRKFEVGMEGLSFLGYPMFARGNGAWRKRRKKRANANGSQEDLGTAEIDQDADAEDEGVDMTGPEDGMTIELPSGYEPGYGHGFSDESSDAGSDAKSASTAGGDAEMTMFNVVFVLNPPALEYQLRTGEMYDNVIRKFARDLKYEQAKGNYVWRESKTILALKNKAKENSECLEKCMTSPGVDSRHRGAHVHALAQHHLSVAVGQGHCHHLRRHFQFQDCPHPSWYPGRCFIPNPAGALYTLHSPTNGAADARTVADDGKPPRRKLGC